jgi:DNA-binding transcriptional LysR family regulator
MVGDVQDMPARIDDWLLFEERYVAVLAPTHHLANRPSIGIDDLRETVLLERAGCDVTSKIQRSYFPEEPLHLGHCSGNDLHLQHMAAAGFGVMLAPEHMPRLPTLKTTRRRWTLSSRSRGFATGRSKSPSGAYRRQRFGRWQARLHDHDTHASGQPLPVN